MKLDDPRWKTLEGGYRVPYDASVDLKDLDSGNDDAIPRLWNELHHQGDVGTASYAAVPALVDIYASRIRDFNFYGLVNVIEICRHHRNPPLPTWLELEYHAAMRDILSLAIQDVRTVEDSDTLREILASMALARGNTKLGAMLSLLDGSEIDAILAGE